MSFNTSVSPAARRSSAPGCSFRSGRGGVPVSRPLQLLLVTGVGAPDSAPLLEELCQAGFDPEWRTLAWPADPRDLGAALSRFGGCLDLALLSGQTPIGPAVAGCAALLAAQSPGLPLLVISPADEDDIRTALT